jgi:hypothetical protein
MDNPTLSSPTINFPITEELDDGPDAEPNYYDPPHVSLKDRSVVPPSSSLKVASAHYMSSLILSLSHPSALNRAEAV